MWRLFIYTLIFQQEEIRKMAMEMKEKKEREKRQWKIWRWFHRKSSTKYKYKAEHSDETLKGLQKLPFTRKCRIGEYVVYLFCLVYVISLQSELLSDLLDFSSKCDFKCLPKRLPEGSNDVVGHSLYCWNKQSETWNLKSPEFAGTEWITSGSKMVPRRLYAKGLGCYGHVSQIMPWHHYAMFLYFLMQPMVDIQLLGQLKIWWTDFWKMFVLSISGIEKSRGCLRQCGGKVTRTPIVHQHPQHRCCHHYHCHHHHHADHQSGMSNHWKFLRFQDISNSTTN